MRNQGNPAGGIDPYDMTLVPEGQIRVMRYQAGLQATSNENVSEDMYSFSLFEDSEYTAQVPYILYGESDEDFQHEIRARRFSYHRVERPRAQRHRHRAGMTKADVRSVLLNNRDSRSAPLQPKMPSGSSLPGATSRFNVSDTERLARTPRCPVRPLEEHRHLAG